MARARVEVRLGVVVRPLVLVSDVEPDGRPERHAVLDPGLQLDRVLLVPLRSVSAGRAAAGDAQAWSGCSVPADGGSSAPGCLRRRAAVPACDQGAPRESDDNAHWRTAIYNRPDRCAVALAVRRDSEERAECGHGGKQIWVRRLSEQLALALARQHFICAGGDAAWPWYDIPCERARPGAL